MKKDDNMEVFNLYADLTASLETPKLLKKVKCQVCKECSRLSCDWYSETQNCCYYEPCDYECDIGSATAKEVILQNEVS